MCTWHGEGTGMAQRRDGGEHEEEMDVGMDIDTDMMMKWAEYGHKH